MAMDLRLTLIDSAQCFRWAEGERGFGAAFDGRAVWLKPGEPVLDPWLRNYLDLDRDYEALFREYELIPAAARALAAFPGLRVLRQPPWEALISFILSANNNVKRIRSLVLALSKAFGREVDGLFSLPEPEKLAAAPEGMLRGLGVGYRAPFLIDTARRVADGFPLDKLREMPYEEAHRLLTSLKGVGDKVADCVLLFGCGHWDAFPVDVWVERLLKSWFHETGTRRHLAAIARQRFGPHGGILQQFLFHAARVGEIAV